MEIGFKGWLDLSGSGQQSQASSCEHGNEPLGSIKGRYFSQLVEHNIITFSRKAFLHGIS
jgi:hypothetical protein